MSRQKLSVGGEVVAYCTKCRLDLDHRIIAMVASSLVKVECRTCGSHHRYHRPMADRVAEARGALSPRAPRASSPSLPRSPSARALAEAQADNEREKVWQSRIAGQPSSAFKAYSPRSTFEQDSLLRHTKFGDGYVVRVIDSGKIDVMFSDGSRVLAQGLTG